MSNSTNMKKIAVNMDFGGFSLSRQAYIDYLLTTEESLSLGEIADINESKYNDFGRDIPRDDPALIAVIEKLGTFAASGACADLGIALIPSNVDWKIHKYDGTEHVEEVHRTWYGETVYPHPEDKP